MDRTISRGVSVYHACSWPSSVTDIMLLELNLIMDFYCDFKSVLLGELAFPRMGKLTLTRA